MDQNLAKKVSIIIPCYNAEQYLRTALESITRQTYAHLEIICVDDGSVDGTFSILENIALKDSRVKVFKNDTNLRLIQTLNKAIDLATGDYIARMDADDIALDDRIEKQVKYIEENKLSICGTYASFFTGDKKLKLTNRLNLVTQPKSILIYSFFDSPFIHPSMMFRKDVIKKYRYRESDESYLIEDYDLWLRMLSGNERIGILPEYLLLYRINEFGESKTKKSIQAEHHLRLSKTTIKNLTGVLISEPSNSLISGLRIDSKLEMYDVQRAILELRKIYSSFLIKYDTTSIEQKEIKAWWRFKKNYIIINGFRFGDIKIKLRLLLSLILVLPWLAKYFLETYLSVLPVKQKMKDFYDKI